MKKKNLLILILIIIVISILVLFSILIIKNNKSINGNNKLTEDRAKELIYNSYVYYVLSSGNIPLDNSEITINGIKYYGINVNISSLDDIDNIIKNSFVSEQQDILLENIYGDSERHFTYINDMLYTNKISINENCNIDYNNLYNNYKINKKKDYYTIDYSIIYNDHIIGSEIPVYYENNKWLLSSPLDMCRD